MARIRAFAAAAGAIALASVLPRPGTARAAVEECFERLDNGVDLTGWVRSATNHHGPGDGWTVEDGALTGRQTSGQSGGILMTTRSYRDVEVVFEVKIDWGCDSGLFFRTTAGDRAYQVNVDHLEGGGIGTIWGESFSRELRVRDFTLTEQGHTVVAEPGRAPLFDLSRWSTMWDPAGWNEVRARVEGNPPRIRTWIAGVQVMDFTDGCVRTELEAAGPLAIQVHGGARWVAGGAVHFRNIRAQDLAAACGADGGSLPDPALADASAGSATPAPCGGPPPSGCSCEVGRPGRAPATGGLVVLAVWTMARARRRQRAGSFCPMRATASSMFSRSPKADRRK